MTRCLGDSSKFGAEHTRPKTGKGRRPLQIAPPTQRLSVAVIMLRQTALRATVLPRTALSRLAARPLCMHDDFKPKIKSYAGDDGDVHAQVRRRRLLVGSTRGLGGPVRAHRSPRTWRRTRWWSS